MLHKSRQAERGEKRCRKCGRYKALTEYHSCKGHKDGFNSYCKACALKIAKAWYRLNKTKPEVYERLSSYWKERLRECKNFVDDLKGSLGCAVCRESEVCCLDFHHLGSKDKGVNALVHAKNWAALVLEIQKCICVCANCHRKIHAGVYLLDAEAISRARQAVCCTLFRRT